jgi:RNA polymerase sigma-70 factor (ECF subfamily)
VLTSPANPSLSLSLISGKTVEMSADSNASSSRVAQLTRRLAAGDEAAFRQFHAEYFDRLYRFLLVATHGHEQEAQEALQQTFLRLVRHVRVFESEEVFWGWLKAVARSAARDGNRKLRRYSALLQRFAVTLHFGRLKGEFSDGDRLPTLLDESLAELLPQERKLLEAKYLEGFTVKELSLQTGLTEKAVESRLERLRQALKRRMLRKLASP